MNYVSHTMSTKSWECEGPGSLDSTWYWENGEANFNCVSYIVLFKPCMCARNLALWIQRGTAGSTTRQSQLVPD